MRLRSEGITWQEIEGELVILDLKRSVYLTTNGSGSLLTKQLTEERSPDELAESLVKAYGISADQARGDVAAFVDQLRAKDLLEEHR